MTDWSTSVTGAIIGLIVGMVVGALLWHWRTAATQRGAARQSHPPMPLLWDIHSVLNAMNKLALTAERGRPVEPALVYLLSDYLLHSALIQREEGWTDRHALESWLLAHVRIIAEHRGQNTLPAVIVQMREDIQRIHASQTLRQLLWFLQKASSVNRIHVQVHSPSSTRRVTRVRIEVEGHHMEIDRTSMPVDEAVISSWSEEPHRSICELRARFEGATVTAATA